MTTKKVGRFLSYDEGIKLGRGSFSYVYQGILENEDGSSKTVAVKRILYSEQDSRFVQREVELMQMAGDHPNILRYICTEKDEYFVFLVTELCKGTLEDYVKGRYQGKKFENERDILLHVTRGLAHLHGLNIVHRDIKPTNILIYEPDGHLGEKPLMKLADFGISKALNAGKDDYTNTSMTNPNGTRGWMAPEMYLLKRFDTKVDIFPLGCIFAYTLTGGKHPFGEDPDIRISRIKQKESILIDETHLNCVPHSTERVFKLIKDMLEMEPANRPTADDVLINPFLQLSDVDHFVVKNSSFATQLSMQVEKVSIASLSVPDEREAILEEAIKHRDEKDQDTKLVPSLNESPRLSSRQYFSDDEGSGESYRLSPVSPSFLSSDDEELKNKLWGHY